MNKIISFKGFPYESCIDRVPVAFEGKFDEKFDEIPTGIFRPHLLQIIQYWGWED